MFSKKTWSDRRVQYPNRRQLVPTGADGTVDIQRAEGSVYTVGDKFNAETMNNLEDRINNAFNTYSNNLKPITLKNKTLSSSSWSSVSKQNWDSKSEYLFRQFVSVSGMTSNYKIIGCVMATEFEEKIGMLETTSSGFYVYAKERISTTVTLLEITYFKG